MNKIRIGIISTALALLLAIPATAAADEPFIGEIKWVAFAFCPRGWADADGQVLQISQYEALFSLLGTTYGGDGRTTFNLPDLRGRVSVHTTDTAPYRLGEKGGLEEVTLTSSEMPAHNHLINASGGAIDKSSAGSILGSPSKKIYDAPVAASTTLDSTAVSDTGGGEAHENRPPYLTLRACIALVGIFPPRN